MSRPSKYNPETVSKFLSLVEEGYTVKNACNQVDITDMTLSRWKKRYPDFVESLNKATSKQWINIESLHRSGVRVYKRNTNKLPSPAEKPLKSDLNALQSHYSVDNKPQFCEGLKIRFGNIAEDEPYTPCVNPHNGMVEYLKRQNGRTVGFSVPSTPSEEAILGGIRDSLPRTQRCKSLTLRANATSPLLRNTCRT